MNQQHNLPVETSAQDAAGKLCPARPLIDIRTVQERELGIPAGAVSISAEDLVQQCTKDGGGIRGGYVICLEGVRSKVAVLKLKEMGFDGFSSVAGGFQAWESGLKEYPNSEDLKKRIALLGESQDELIAYVRKLRGLGDPVDTDLARVWVK